MKAIKQYAEVENGYLHLKLPDDFTEKSVEVIILSRDKLAEKIETKKSRKLYAHKINIDNFVMPKREDIYD